jgi:hypothetical protein
MRKANDPRCYIGDVVVTAETDDGLAITGRFDLGTEFGKSAYRNTKGRIVSGLSIGCAIRNSTKTAAGNELTDLELIGVSIVARGANDRPLVSQCNAGVKADQGRVVPPGCRIGAATGQPT